MDFSWKDTVVLAPLAIGGGVWPIWSWVSPQTCDAKAITICFLSGLCLSFLWAAIRFYKIARGPKGLMDDWERQRRKLKAFEDAHLYMSGVLSHYNNSGSEDIQKIRREYLRQMKLVEKVANNEKN